MYCNYSKNLKNFNLYIVHFLVFDLCLNVDIGVNFGVHALTRGEM